MPIRLQWYLSMVLLNEHEHDIDIHKDWEDMLGINKKKIFVKKIILIYREYYNKLRVIRYYPISISGRSSEAFFIFSNSLSSVV